MISLLVPYISIIIILVVSLEILAAIYYDIKAGIVPNKINLIFLCTNLIALTLLRSFPGLGIGMTSFLLAFVILLPCFLLKILGGGDIKLILAISPLLFWEEIIGFIFMSLLWGGVLGLFDALIKGKLKTLLENTLLAINRSKVAEHKVPFTVGIFLGWLSYRTVISLGFI